MVMSFLWMLYRELKVGGVSWRDTRLGGGLPYWRSALLCLQSPIRCH